MRVFFSSSSTLLIFPTKLSSTAMADSVPQGGGSVVLQARHNLLHTTTTTASTESAYSSTYYNNPVRDSNFPGRTNYLSPFQRKLLTLACILIVIPLIPSKPPHFFGNTFFSKIWDFLRFSIIGIVISYGLCHQTDDHVDFETQSGVTASNFTDGNVSSGFRYNSVYSSPGRSRFRSYINENAIDRDELDLVDKNFALEFSDLDASSSIHSTEHISRSEISSIPFLEGDGKHKKLSPSGNDIPFTLSGDVKPKKLSNPIQTSSESNASNEDEQPIKLASQHCISSTITMNEHQKKSNSDLKNKAGIFLQRDQHFHRRNAGMVEEIGLKLSTAEPKASPWSYFESDLMQSQVSPLISSNEEMETVIHDNDEETGLHARATNNSHMRSGGKAHHDPKPENDRYKQSEMLRLMKETDQLAAQMEELNDENNYSYSSTVPKSSRPKIDEKKLPFSITASKKSSHFMDSGTGKSSTMTSFLNSEEPESKIELKTKELSSTNLKKSEIHGSGVISDRPLMPRITTVNEEDRIIPKNITVAKMDHSDEKEKEDSFGDDQRVLESKALEEIEAKAFAKASSKGKSVRTFRSKVESGIKSADADGVQRKMYENIHEKPEFELSDTSEMKMNNSQDEINKAENMHTRKGHGSDEFVAAEAESGRSKSGADNTNIKMQNHIIENHVMEVEKTSGSHGIEGRSINPENSKDEKEMRSKPEKRSGFHRLWNGFRKQSAGGSTAGMARIRDMIRDQTEKDMNGNGCSNYEGEFPVISGGRRQNKENVVLSPKSASRRHIVEPKEERFKNKCTYYRDEGGDLSETDGNGRSCGTTNEIDKRASDFISRFRKQMQVEKVPVIVNEIDLRAGEFISKFKERIKHEKTSVKFW